MIPFLRALGGSGSSSSSPAADQNSGEQAQLHVPRSDDSLTSVPASNPSGALGTAASLPTQSSHSSLSSAWTNYVDVAWDAVRLGVQIEPCSRYASCTDDIHLLSALFLLVQFDDVHSDSIKLLFKTLRFLRLCDYSTEDICVILAHASTYFLDAHALCGNEMDARESGNVLSLLMFVAHCYVQDETCPIKVWHHHLFRRYCTLPTLNLAVVRLLEIRRYRLRIPDEDLDRCMESLLGAVGLHFSPPSLRPSGHAPVPLRRSS